MYNITNECPAPTPVRWLYVIPMSAASTFGLFLLMFKLVYMEEVVINDDPVIDIPNVTWEERPPIQTIRKKLERPIDVVDTPPKPQPSSPDVIDVVTIPRGEYEKPPITVGLNINSNAPIEHFMVTPRYPGRALTKGIEGFVELRFDVNKAGATENIEVLRAEPKGIFEDAAIAAAARWKFQPKTEDGEPVYFRGLSKLVTFEMQKS